MPTTRNLITHITRGEVNPYLRSRYIQNRNEDPLDEAIKIAVTEESQQPYSPQLWMAIVGPLVPILLFIRAFIPDVPGGQGVLCGFLWLFVFVGGIACGLQNILAIYQWKLVQKNALDQKNEFMIKLSLVSKVLGLSVEQIKNMGKRELAPLAKRRLMEFKKGLRDKEAETKKAKEDLPDSEATYTSCLDSESVTRTYFEAAHLILTEFGLITESYDAFDPLSETPPTPPASAPEPALSAV